VRPDEKLIAFLELERAICIRLLTEQNLEKRLPRGLIFSPALNGDSSGVSNWSPAAFAAKRYL